jgi:hypothetical protein
MPFQAVHWLIWRSVLLITVALSLSGFGLVLVRRRWPVLVTRVATDLAFFAGLPLSAYLVRKLVEAQNQDGVQETWIHLGPLHAATPWIVAIILGVLFSKATSSSQRRRAAGAA